MSADHEGGPPRHRSHKDHDIKAETVEEAVQLEKDGVMLLEVSGDGAQQKFRIPIFPMHCTAS